MTNAGLDRKMKMEKTPEEHFMYLQKKRVSSPDSFGPLAIHSVFRKDRVIIKALKVSKPMQFKSKGPMTQEQKNREVKQTMKEPTNCTGRPA
ncbi:MAG: hypothetical protein ABSB80_11150 [Methanoregula sp.]|jgi:hypothetical protein|uniref:hypothetical protein n=1 Tax=Methanoregula sp. TaxID=2052170 RepID=UPI003D106E02